MFLFDAVSNNTVMDLGYEYYREGKHPGSSQMPGPVGRHAVDNTVVRRVAKQPRTSIIFINSTRVTYLTLVTWEAD